MPRTNGINNCLDYLEEHVAMLPINSDVWQRAVTLSQQLRAQGQTVPLPDLLIFSCVAVHDVEIEHTDKHFDRLQQLFPVGI